MPQDRHLRSKLCRTSILRDTRGSGMVEVAICSLAVLLAILGAMECSRALYVEHAISGMARDAARYASVRGSGWAGTSCATIASYSCDATASDVSGYALGNLSPGISTTSLTVSTTWTGMTAAGTACDTTAGNNSAGCIVHVQVTYPFTFLLPLPSSAAIQFNSNATMTISR